MKKSLRTLSLIALMGFMVACNNATTSSISSSVNSNSSSTVVSSDVQSSSDVESSSSVEESQSSSEEESSSEELSSSTEESSSEESSSTESSNFQTYYHKFSKNDFVSAGGNTENINGLIWNYSQFSFLGGAQYGVQIGSKNNPQTSDWTLQTSFPDGVKVASYSFETCNASGGSANYSVSFGQYTKSDTFSSANELIIIEDKNLNELSSSFSLTLKSNAKAIYLYSISLNLYVPEDVDLKVSGDEENAAPVIPGEKDIPNINYQPMSKEDYYQGINLDDTGDTLITSLRTKISNMTKTSYGDAKTMLQYTDENPNKPGYLYGLYDGDSILAQWDSGASWNREHVWACSQMKLNGTDPRPSESQKNHATDLHNLRVACQVANGEHGNKFYDETDSSTTLYPNITKTLTGYHAYEGDFRGDVARILFYMFVRYEGLVLNDDLDVNNDVSMGKLSVLLSWNKLDPVDEFETQRNNRIYSYQGNRNPFIDYPDLSDKIFNNN